MRLDKPLHVPILTVIALHFLPLFDAAITIINNYCMSIVILMYHRSISYHFSFDPSHTQVAQLHLDATLLEEGYTHWIAADPL